MCSFEFIGWSDGCVTVCKGQVVCRCGIQAFNSVVPQRLHTQPADSATKSSLHLAGGADDCKHLAMFWAMRISLLALLM